VTFPGRSPSAVKSRIELRTSAHRCSIDSCSFWISCCRRDDSRSKGGSPPRTMCGSSSSMMRSRSIDSSVVQPGFPSMIGCPLSSRSVTRQGTRVTFPRRYVATSDTHAPTCGSGISCLSASRTVVPTAGAALRLSSPTPPTPDISNCQPVDSASPASWLRRVTIWIDFASMK
jgi:hypothetical protein